MRPHPGSSRLPDVFLCWAIDYFSSRKHLNTPIPRKTLFSSYSQSAGYSSCAGVTRTNFKAKLIQFCQCKGYMFNPQMPPRDDDFSGNPFIGADDKRNGIEYFTISKYKSCKH